MRFRWKENGDALPRASETDIEHSRLLLEWLVLCPACDESTLSVHGIFNPLLVPSIRRRIRERFDLRSTAE